MSEIPLVKLVAMDIDGTLMGPDKRLSPRLKAVMEALLVRGVKLVLASGRMAEAARPVALELGLDDMPLICLNGALITQARESKVLWQFPFADDLAQQVVDAARASNAHIQSYHGEELWVGKESKWLEAYVHRLKVHYRVVDWSMMAPGALKFLVLGEPELAISLRERWNEQFGDALAMSNSLPGYLDIVTGGVSKALAVKTLADHYAIAPREVAAFGDADNDLEMLQYAGWAVAVGDPPDVVRQVASRIVPAPAEDGAAIGLEELLERLDGATVGR